MRYPYTLHRRRLLAAFLLGASSMSFAFPPQDAVTLEQAREALSKGTAIVIDIREPEEHARGVAAGAVLLPMSQLRTRVQEIPNTGDRPVYLICNTQNRSSTTLRALRPHGYSHVRYVQGGMSDWVRRGWPVVAPGTAAAPAAAPAR